MTVAEMRATISGQEWLEWSVYYRRKAQRTELEVKRARGNRH